MPFSEAIDNAILDHFTGKATWAAPAAIYMGLSSTTPTKTGTNVTEPTGVGSYARVQITAAQFASAASSATTTNVEKAFAAASADWGTDPMTHIVFYSALSGGNFLGFKALGEAKRVYNGDTAKYAAGDIDIAMGGT